VATGLIAAAAALGGAAVAQAATGTVTPSTTTVTPGGFVTLTVEGFTPEEFLSFELDGTTPLRTYAVNGGAEVADANGDYVGDATLPRDAAVGSHTISVTDSSASNTASTVVTVVPQPTSSVTPSSIALSDYLANGVTATFSGFEPGATVSFGVSNEGSGDQVGSDVLAGPTGDVTFRYVPQAGGNYANAGSYRLLAASEDLSYVSEPAEFTVTADQASPADQVSPAAPAPVAGPATPVKRAATFTG
jgi:hypothetical protein